MEELLGGLNKHLIEVLHELNTTYRDDVQKLQSIPKSPDEIPPQIQGLKETVEHLSELELLLKPPLHTVIDGIFAFSISKALSAAITYKIPDVLEENGPLPVEILSSKTDPKTTPGALTQILRLLSSTGIFSYNLETDTFSNNTASSLLTSSHWTQWRRWAELYPTTFYDIFANLEPAIAETEQRSATHITYAAEATEPLFVLLSKLPWAKSFFETIGAGSTAMAPGLLADYPWHELLPGPVCDLGGGNGEFLFTILDRFSEMTGAVLELEDSTALRSAVQNFNSETGKFSSVNSRLIDVHSGNFLREVPSYPFYTIRWTLHNWGDDETVQILKNVRTAILKSEQRQGRRLLVVEAVVKPNEVLSRPAMYGSLVMMSGAKNGKERSEREWQELCQRSGWRIHRVFDLRNCIPNILDLRPVE